MNVISPKQFPKADKVFLYAIDNNAVDWNKSFLNERVSGQTHSNTVEIFQLLFLINTTSGRIKENNLLDTRLCIVLKSIEILIGIFHIFLNKILPYWVSIYLSDIYIIDCEFQKPDGIQN